MEARETILQELNGISEIVATIGSDNVFNIPVGFFDRFSDSVWAKINAEPVAELGGKTDPFAVPVGYFDGLAENILQRIRTRELSVKEELNELAPILNTISRAPVYSVPSGYFESLELTIPLKLGKPSARLFNFSKPKRIMQYAVAASFAAILMVAAYLYNDTNGSGETPISYNKAIKMNVAKELDQLNEADIASYLEEAPTIGYALNVTPEEVDFDEYLDAASDEEINQYLNETAEPAETGNGS